MALGWLLNLALGGASAGASATISGSLADGVLEAEIQRTFQDVVIRLTNDTFLTFTPAIKQAIIDNITSSGTAAKGWNNEVRDKVEIPSVTRVSDTICRISFAPSTAYEISADETITVTIPASALTLGSALTATPTFAVTAATASGTAISNSTATTDVPNNIEHCAISGFRVLPGELEKDGYGQLTRPRSKDQRHPQDSVRSTGGERHKGSKSPEQDNRFVGTDISTVSASDL